MEEILSELIAWQEFLIKFLEKRKAAARLADASK